jgi:hypothetical protein
MIRSLVGIAVVPLLVFVAPVAAQDVPVYTDALQSGFQDFSFGGGSVFANPLPTHSGNASIALTGNNFNAVSFAHPSGAFATATYPRLRFFVHGGATGGQQLRLILQIGDPSVPVRPSVELDGYIPGGVIQANVWTEVVVRFADPPLSFAGAFDRIDLQTAAPGGAQPVLYIDDVTLLAGDGPPAPVNPLLIDRDVTVDLMVSDRFTWRDAGNQPRVAVLAHNDGQIGPGGTRGGELREFRYETPGETRIVRASGSGASGFGYVVSHRSEGNAGLGGADDSPLGHQFPGQFQRVFEGRHHAIFRFTQLYPRYSRQNAMPPNTQYDVPVTLDWVFSTGRDHPLWAITWDLSGVPVDAVESDSRAPYGELLFDGSASEGAHSVIAGVGWGDRFKFVSTTNPVTYNSPWTWNTPNTIPYVKLWTTAVDATMGTVETQTIVQQDAGGYFGTNRWGTTSAPGDGGAACNANVEGPGLAAHLMPCSFNWPYQSINFSMGAVIGQDDNVPTFNTRLAWGTNFGFLGQAQYPIHGTDLFGGPLLGNPTASGHPRKSYSTHVVLGLHSADPVGAQVAQVETVQNTTVTASIGSVVTSGPAGINRADPVTYAPAGWNHVYAAWALQAAANQVDANFNVGAGTLSNPLVIVSSWTAGALPGTVRFNGATLVQDADYFPSLRAGSLELWITINRNLIGATNRLEIVPAPAAAFPALSLQINAPSFGANQALTLTATLTSGPTPLLVDAYVVIRLPDSSLFSLLLDGRLVPGIVPIATGITPTPLTRQLLSYTFNGGEPAGTYTWMSALTQAGTGNIIGSIQEVPFTVVLSGGPTASQLLAKMTSCTQISNGVYATDVGLTPTVPVCDANGAAFVREDGHESLTALRQ